MGAYFGDSLCLTRPILEIAEKNGSAFNVRLGYFLTPCQRLWLYNGAPLVAFYDTRGIRRTFSRLKPPASSRGRSAFKKGVTTRSNRVGKVPKEDVRLLFYAVSATMAI